MNILTHYIVSLTVTAIAMFSMGFFVFLQNPKREINWSFALYYTAIAWWSIWEAYSINAPTRLLGLWAWRINHMGVIFIPIFFVHFIYSILEIPQKNRKLLKVIYVIGFCLVALNLTNLLIANVIPKFSFKYMVVPGPFYLSFVIWWGITITYGLVKLRMAFLRSRGTRRNQLRYLWIGSLIGYIGGPFNFLPAFNIEIFPIMPFGTYAVPFYSAILTYAIVRHHLMDIEVLVKKTLIFASLFAIVLGIFVGITVLTQELIAGGRLLGLAISSIVIILAVRPLEDFLVKLTDKYLFQKKYDYRQILKAFIDEVLTVLDLDRIVAGTKELLNKTLHPNQANIMLFDKKTSEYIDYGNYAPNNERNHIKDSSPLIVYLVKTKNILSLENKDSSAISQSIKEEMRRFNAVLAAPLLLQNELIGIMLLGSKKSDESYTNDDLSIIDDLARTEAIALKNAQFYERSSKEIAEVSERRGAENTAIGASHQMKNVLAKVRAAAELVHVMIAKSEEGSLAPDKKEALFSVTKTKVGEILNTTDKGKDMLDAVLYRAKAKEKFVQIDLSNLIKRAIENSAHAKSKEITEANIPLPLVDNKIQDDFPDIVGNERLIEECFVNLINNAYDAIVSRYIDLKPSKLYRGHIEIKGEDKGDSVAVIIEDDGIGMTDEVKKRIFGGFFTSKAVSQKGTGVGLFFLRKWIEEHKGHISFTSEYGKGTAFIIKLPKKQGEVA